MYLVIMDDVCGPRLRIDTIETDAGECVILKWDGKSFSETNEDLVGKIVSTFDIGSLELANDMLVKFQRDEYMIFTSEK